MAYIQTSLVSGPTIPVGLGDAALAARLRTIVGGLSGLICACWGEFLNVLLDDLERRLFLSVDATADSAEKLRRFEQLRAVKRERAEVVARYLRDLDTLILNLLPTPRRGKGAVPGRSGFALPGASGATMLDPLLSCVAAQLDAQQRVALNALGRRFSHLAGKAAFDTPRLPIGPGPLCRLLQSACASVQFGADIQQLLLEGFALAALSRFGNFYERVNAYLVEQQVLPDLAVLNAPARIGALLHAAPAALAPSPSNSPLALASSNEAGDAADYQASREDVLAVLNVLRYKPLMLPPLLDATAPRYRSRLKLDLLAQLRQFAPPGGAAQLPPEVANAVEAIDHLFDQLAKNLKARSGVQDILGRLRIPLLRIALLEPGFFCDDEHPARTLLALVVEVCTRWLQHAGTDPWLMEKTQALVERLCAAGDDARAAFEQAQSDLTAWSNALARKAELAERRLVDAAKGRERLDGARQQASLALAKLLRAYAPGHTLRAALLGAWTDVLALTLLRHGKYVRAFRQRLAVAEALLARAARTTPGGAPIGPIERDALRAELESGLSQIGILGADLSSAVDGLLASVGAVSIDAAEVARALRLLAPSRLGKLGFGGAITELPTIGNAAIDPPLDAVEQTELDALCRLPFGTWFAFESDAHLAPLHRRLAWFSQASCACLWVNEYGNASAGIGLAQLARELVAGRALRIESEELSLFERAWSVCTAMAYGAQACQIHHARHAAKLR